MFQAEYAELSCRPCGGNCFRKTSILSSASMLRSDPCGTATGHGNWASDLCETMISRHIILSVLEVGQAVTVGVRARGFAAVGQLDLLFFSGTLSQLLVLAAVHIHLLPTCRRTSTQRSSRYAPVPCPSGLCKRVDGAGPCCTRPRLSELP